MGRPKKWPPTIYHHHSGHDWIRVDGEPIWLGATGSPKAKARYAKIVSRVASGQPPVIPPCQAAGVTVAEVCARFVVEDVEKRYLHADGTPTGEVDHYNQSLRPLIRRHGDRPIDSLRLDDLEATRGDMLSGAWLTADERAKRPKNLQRCCRKTTNKRVWRILRMLRWAKRHRLMSAESYGACCDIEPLAVGSHGAIEYDEIPPVPESDLAATLPYLNHVVRAMVEIQLLTGARPGEIVRLRPCDLNRSGRFEIARGIVVEMSGVWSYHPKWREGRTKTKGSRRIILFGPKAQAILNSFLDRQPEVYLFSPAEAMATRRAALRAKRKSKVQPSQQCANRRKRHTGASRRPRDHYRVCAYANSIRKAIKQARKAGQTVNHFHPHQLRHNAATRITAEFGPEMARILLGHRSIATTRIYVLDCWRKAAEVVKIAG